MGAHIFVVHLENRRRDRLIGPSGTELNEEIEEHALTNDLTDGENPRFRFMT